MWRLKYWLSFLEMSQVLPNIIFTTESGKWELLLESLRVVVPFSYDNVHYAIYLRTMLLAEMHWSCTGGFLSGGLLLIYEWKLFNVTFGEEYLLSHPA